MHYSFYGQPCYQVLLHAVNANLVDKDLSMAVGPFCTEFFRKERTQIVKSYDRFRSRWITSYGFPLPLHTFKNKRVESYRKVKVTTLLSMPSWSLIFHIATEVYIHQLNPTTIHDFQGFCWSKGKEERQDCKFRRNALSTGFAAKWNYNSV